MSDPYLGMLTLAVFTVVIGAVVFGGLTLTYFLDKRRPERATRSQVPEAPSATTRATTTAIAASASPSQPAARSQASCACHS